MLINSFILLFSQKLASKQNGSLEQSRLMHLQIGQEPAGEILSFIYKCTSRLFRQHLAY